MDNLKRQDQIALLEKCLKFSETNVREGGIFTYPGCGPDLVSQGLVMEDWSITMAGRAALYLLGKGPDPTSSRASVEIQLERRNCGHGKLP